MKKIKLGKHLEVSVIGLGSINFGTKTSQEESFQLLDTYFQLGGNFIDTSNNYAVWNGGNGHESEHVIGNWVKKRGNREKVVIATKVGARPKDLLQKDFSHMEGLSREVILESVQQSLYHLQTNYIDLLYLHVDDFSVPQDEVMATLNELIEKGIVKEIGCSNFLSWRIESARQICKERNYHFFSVIQQRYSYLKPTIDSDFYPQIALNQDLAEYLKYYKDLTLVAYSPLLKGQYNQTEIMKEKYDTQENKNRLNALSEKDIDPNIWVMNYIIHSFGQSIALLTTSSLEHLKEIVNGINS